MSIRCDCNNLLLVIPTYNEVDNIGPLVRRVHEVLLEADILIVDDGSPDGTGALADSLAADDTCERIYVMHRPDKGGLGSAYMEGFRWGLARQPYDLFAQLDADGSHDPGQLPDLIGAIEQGADFAIGSRYLPGGSTSQWNAGRLKLSQVSNLYAQKLLSTQLNDLTSGFRVYTRRAMASGALAEVHSMSFCFQVEMTFRLAERGFIPAEVPIVFHERQNGESKMTSAMVWEGFILVSELGLRARVQRVATLVNRVVTVLSPGGGTPTSEDPDDSTTS